MRFTPSSINGCFIVDIEPHKDSRGMFARTWCSKEFAHAGLPENVVQCSISRNAEKGTLRGLHFQLPPSNEAKLVRCTKGSISDVVVDIRSESDTFLRSFQTELSAENCRALFIPPGCAHGFQTLDDDSDVYYQMTDEYVPDLGAGLRWDDPAFGIDWPLPNPIMHDRDRNYSDLDRSLLRSLKWGS
jgi:dTDP-4-dehydrorhamnose 3,5-epimerase